VDRGFNVGGYGTRHTALFDVRISDLLRLHVYVILTDCLEN